MIGVLSSLAEEREELRANYKRRVELLRAAMLEASSDIEGADADQLALLEVHLKFCGSYV